MNTKRAPKVRFKGFTDAWEQRKFESIATRASSISADPTLPQVEYEDIISGIGLLNKDVKLKESSKQGIVFNQGDVLYGKLRPYLHNWLLPTFSGLAVGDFWVLQPKDADSSFLFRLIQGQQFDDVANQSTGTKMPRADWNLVSKTLFFIPTSIDEQALIGRYFRSIDNLIALHQRKLGKIKDLKKAFLNLIFSQKLRFYGFSDSWELCKASTLFASTADKGYSELPVLSATQDRGMIKREENNLNIFHDKKNEKSYKRVVPGQFVIHLRSFQGGFAYSAIEGITSPAYTVFGFKEQTKHSGIFWRYVFSSKDFIRRLETVTYGIRDGRSINYDEFLAMKFVFPNAQEQSQIAKFLTHLDNLITLRQEKINQLTKLKTTFLKNMFI